MIRTSDKTLAFLTLFCGLTISAVAIWYSVSGLVAIFAAATIPIIVMGTVLELSKLVASVWLKWNWKKAPVLIRAYLLSAIVILMVLTSMGIFGFLSKAHLDQAVPTGDIAAKVAMIDEKIATQRENIESARRALAQMDSTVDQTISRSTTENGATKAAQLRRSQQKERAQLQADISKSQKAIALLNEERAPIAAELRKVEAEVGPIKYIAALIYGDNPDANLLERAVRWVIIIIVVVFDPLAVILLLASQYSFQWFRQQDTEEIVLVGLPPITKNEKVEPVVPQYKEPDEYRPVAQLAKTEPLEFSNMPTFDAITDISTFERFGLPAATTFSHLATTTADPVVEEVTDTNLTEEDTTDDQPPIERPGDYLTDHSFVEDIKDLEIEVEVEEQIEKDNDEEVLNTATSAEREAMQRWKEENPSDSLKHQHRLFEMKLIDRLPWHDQLTAKPDYVQNAEQSVGTIWQKLKASKTYE